MVRDDVANRTTGTAQAPGRQPQTDEELGHAGHEEPGVERAGQAGPGQRLGATVGVWRHEPAADRAGRERVPGLHGECVKGRRRGDRVLAQPEHGIDQVIGVVVPDPEPRRLEEVGPQPDEEGGCRGKWREQRRGVVGRPARRPLGVAVPPRKLGQPGGDQEDDPHHPREHLHAQVSDQTRQQHSRMDDDEIAGERGQAQMARPAPGAGGQREGHGGGQGARVQRQHDALYWHRHGLQRVVPVHQRLPRAVRPPRGHLPLPHLRRPPRGPARHGGAPVAVGRGVDAALRRALPPQHLPLRLGRLGQEGVGGALHRQREHRVDVRGQLEPPLGRPLRQAAPRRGPVGQAVRQLAHRVVQGPRHDGAGLGGQADDRGRRAHRRGGLRLDRRHLGRARRLLRGGRHPLGGAPAQGQGLDRPARAAARQRRARALARHRLRRLHGGRPGDHQGEAHLPGQLDEQPAHRGAEDGRHRDRPAVRLGGAGLDHHPRRQPRQRARARAGLR